MDLALIPAIRAKVNEGCVCRTVATQKDNTTSPEHDVISHDFTSPILPSLRETFIWDGRCDSFASNIFVECLAV